MDSGSRRVRSLSPTSPPEGESDEVSLRDVSINMTWYQRKDNCLTLTVYIQPGAKRTEIIGLHDDALKIRVAAAAIEGQANARLLEFLRKAFKVPASRIAVKHGEHARRKVVEIQGSLLEPEALLRSTDIS